MDNVYRLRRFALTLSVIGLLTAIAGVELKEDVTVGFTAFKVHKPHYARIALSIACVVAALRFWYFGLLLEESPARRRAKLLGLLEERGLRSHPWEPGFLPERLLRPIRKYALGYRYRPSLAPMNDRQAREYAEEVALAHPQFGRWQTSMTTEQWRQEAEDGSAVVVATTAKRVSIGVPGVIVWLCHLEQLDYTAPLWMNAIAVASLLSA